MESGEVMWGLFHILAEQQAQHLLQVTSSACGGEGQAFGGQFWSIKTRTNPFWVYLGEAKINLAEFFGQI